MKDAEQQQQQIPFPEQDAPPAAAPPLFDEGEDPVLTPAYASFCDHHKEEERDL